jgi:hypothetical protein
LHASGFDGYFSLEPHLARAEAASGFSGPELWGRASASFKKILHDRNIEWA